MSLFYDCLSSCIASFCPRIIPSFLHVCLFYRYEMFATRSTQSSHLPPCQDALRKHIARANYQAGIWRRSLEPQPVIPEPHGHNQGWVLDSNEDLLVDWLSLPSAPECVLEFVSCGCRTGCMLGRCSCHRQSLPCTDVCSCSDVCTNRVIAAPPDDLEE